MSGALGPRASTAKDDALDAGQNSMETLTMLLPFLSLIVTRGPAHRRLPRDRRPSGRTRAVFRLEPLEGRTLLSPGDLDPTFGNGGIVTTTLTPSGGVGVHGLVVEPNGDLVAAGYAAGFTEQALARYTPSGALDPTFGTGGIVLQQNGSGQNGVLSLALQSNSDLVAGVFGPKIGDGLKRFTTSGALDPTFGTNGLAINPDMTYAIWGLAIQPTDGKIVTAGTTVATINGVESNDFVVSRYNTNGTLDTTFGNNGNAITTFNGLGAAALTVVIQPDGKILAGGYRSKSGVNANDIGLFALARYNPNGTLDTTFGTGGLVTTSIANEGAGITGMVLQPDGKIVAVTSISGSKQEPDGTYVGIQTVLLVRYNPDGSLDTTFGSGGIDRPDATAGPGNGGEPGEGVALEPNGDIMTAGYVQNASFQNENEVAVFNPDGSLDNNFGGTGVVTTPVSGGGGAQAVAVQPADGNIVTAGFAASQFFLARYIGDTTTPSSQLVVAQQPPASVSAGSPFGLTVDAVDSSGNLESSFNGTVTVALLNNPRGATLGGTLTATATKGVATFSGLTLTSAAAGYTLEFSSSGLGAGLTSPITVTPAAPTQVVVIGQPPSSVTAGSGFGLEAVIEDMYGNVVTSDNASVYVALATNPSGATLGGTLSEAASNGVATFSGLTLTIAASGYTLSVSSSGLTGSTTSAITVTAAAATQLVITQEPPGSVAKNADFVVVALIEDQYGNVVTSDDNTVTLALANNPTGAKLGGKLSVKAVNGVVTFSGLTLNKLGSGYTLMLSSSGLTSATTNAITVT